MRSPKPKFMELPPGFCPAYATIDEVSAYARQSRWTTHVKIRAGRYETFKDGRIRKIIFSSVLRDIERLRAGLGAGPIEPVEKRRPGRPKKIEQSASAG
jgi:hypothetical protein